MEELTVNQMENLEGGVCLEPVSSLTGQCITPCDLNPQSDACIQ